MAAMDDPTTAPEFETKDVGFGRSTEVQDEQAPREPAGITRAHREIDTDEETQR